MARTALFVFSRMQKFTDVRVWERSHKLTMAIFLESEKFPSRYRFSITQQLQRAMASVPTNLAEGSKAESPADYAHYINICEKSVAEVQYLLRLHRDLGHLSAEKAAEFQREAAGIARQLHALKESVRRNNNLAF
jgi:four helix bundle protein